MKYFGMTVVAAGLALTTAYYFGAQSVGYAEAGSESCRYSVETVTGKTTMRSFLNVSLDQATPSGESTPDLHSYMRVNVSAMDSGCETVTVERMMVDMAATDNGGKAWIRRAARSGLTLEDVDTGEVVTTGVAARITTSGVRFYTQPFTLRSGETRTLDIYVDADGASDEFDDMIQLSFPSNAFTWSDEHRSVHAMSDAIEGETVTF